MSRSMTYFQFLLSESTVFLKYIFTSHSLCEQRRFVTTQLIYFHTKTNVQAEKKTFYFLDNQLFVLRREYHHHNIDQSKCLPFCTVDSHP